jgi:hypothetical protein
LTITAKIIADSINEQGNRITTYELEYPRFIHSEFMTHRLFSRNAASSRAIPVSRAIGLIKEDTAMPIHWGKNQPGMSAKEECYNDTMGGDNEFHGFTRKDWWNEARDQAILHAEEFSRCGYHKQIVNRLLEPFTHIKVVCTATEYDNFFYLRRHSDAQPEIHELANRMWEAREASTPVPLNPGDWHVPYFGGGYWKSEFINDHTNEELDSTGKSLQEALAISSSCCAQVSYRVLDESLEKAMDIYKRLVESKPPHLSPVEHQATPMVQYNLDSDGVTHMDKYKNLWSGNLKGWTQYRQLLYKDFDIEFMTSSKTP